LNGAFFGVVNEKVQSLSQDFGFGEFNFLIFNDPNSSFIKSGCQTDFDPLKPDFPRKLDTEDSSNSSMGFDTVFSPGLLSVA
jgi:hypothetical protein